MQAGRAGEPWLPKEGASRFPWPLGVSGTEVYVKMLSAGCFFCLDIPSCTQARVRGHASFLPRPPLSTRAVLKREGLPRRARAGTGPISTRAASQPPVSAVPPSPVFRRPSSIPSRIHPADAIPDLPPIPREDIFQRRLPLPKRASPSLRVDPFGATRCRVNWKRPNSFGALVARQGHGGGSEPHQPLIASLSEPGSSCVDNEPVVGLVTRLENLQAGWSNFG